MAPNHVIPNDMPPIGIPAVPLSPGETIERDEGSTETGLEAAHGERRALGWAAITAVAAIVWIALPVGVGILLGTLLAFAVQPVFEPLKPRLGAGWSARVVVIATLLSLGGALDVGTGVAPLVTFVALLGGVRTVSSPPSGSGCAGSPFRHRAGTTGRFPPSTQLS